MLTPDQRNDETVTLATGILPYASGRPPCYAEGVSATTTRTGTR